MPPFIDRDYTLSNRTWLGRQRFKLSLSDCDLHLSLSLASVFSQSTGPAGAYG